MSFKLKDLNPKKIVTYILFLYLGWAINHYPIDFNWGHTFFLGGIFTFLIFFNFSLPLTLLGAVLINIPTMGFWHHPYYLVFVLFEVVFLWFARKRGYKNYLGTDALFWVVGGVPLALILFSFTNDSLILRVTFLAIYGVTSIFSLTLIILLFVIASIIKTRLMAGPDRSGDPISTVLFNLTTFGVLVLGIINYTIESDQLYERTLNETSQLQTNEIARLLPYLEKENLKLEQVSQIFETCTFNVAFLKEGKLVHALLGKDPFTWDQDLLDSVIVEKEQRILYNQGQELLPDNPWKNTFLIYQYPVHFGAIDKILLASPLDDSSLVIQAYSLKSLILLVVIIYAAMGIAATASAIFSGPIVKLKKIVEALSLEEVDSLNGIEWPRSVIEEIHDLIELSKQSYGNILNRNIQLSSLNQSLEYTVKYDQLTRLYNRGALFAILEKSIEKGVPLALAIIDLDNFKLVNDTRGHLVGDMLLVEYAFRLSSLGDQYYAARLGGDEFAIIISDFENQDTLADLMTALMENVRKPIYLEGELYSVNSSAGVSLFPEQGGTVPELLRCADLAMYTIKTSGKNNWRLYSDDLSNALSHYEMERSIRKAFDDDQFELYFQPQVDIRTGEIISMEALIRWSHAEQGFISPSLFIPIAERMDIIIPIGYWVIEEAAKKGKILHEEGFKGIISVNVSPRQFAEDHFYEKTIAILEREGFEPEYFGIEVTETMVMGNVEFNCKIISQFMDRGIHVSIDDFGTGYTSLSLLQDLKVNTLKIDQSFVEKVGRSRKNEIVLNNIINLTKELDMGIVIEGVETEEQKSFFRDRACYTLQGFLHYKPMSFEEVRKTFKIANDPSRLT